MSIGAKGGARVPPLGTIGIALVAERKCLVDTIVEGVDVALGVLPSILAAGAAERERDRLETLQWRQRQLGGERGVEQMDAADERHGPTGGARS